MTVIEFVVLGTPRPQGSARPYTYKRKDGTTGARVDSDSKYLKGWRHDVAIAALAAMPMRGRLLDGPVRVVIHAFFDRPKRTKRADGTHVSKPDVDKICRAVMDGMTGVVYVDDAQVQRLNIGKWYAARGKSSGVRVRVEGE
jgi:Holliday junction resolvase RusA-like endonuclease